jgi:hypothetical protein
MSSLPSEEIISSHKVEPSVQVNCNFLCYEKSNCVGFNFRTKTNVENCQLTYTTRISKTHAREGEWILFHDVDVVSYSYIATLICSFIVCFSVILCSEKFNYSNFCWHISPYIYLHACIWNLKWKPNNYANLSLNRYEWKTAGTSR